MKYVGIAIILFASLCCAQEAGDFSAFFNQRVGRAVSQG